jgi:non-ribosomal peptide synthetase component E (peptide arylation enzyme)
MIALRKSADQGRANLANYKLPKYFDIMTNPPLLPVGKIDKKRIASRMLAKIKGE